MILIDHVLPSGTSSSGHDQRSQGAVRDAQAGLDALLGAAPDGVLVLDREHDVEPALVERVYDPGPVDLPETRHPVPPPADVPRVGPLHRPTGPAVAVAGRDPVELAVGQARGQEFQFHAGTSTQLCSAPAVTTAWVNTAARRPSMNVGRPSGFCPAIAAYTSETKALNASW